MYNRYNTAFSVLPYFPRNIILQHYHSMNCIFIMDNNTMWVDVYQFTCISGTHVLPIKNMLKLVGRNHDRPDWDTCINDGTLSFSKVLYPLSYLVSLRSNQSGPLLSLQSCNYIWFLRVKLLAEFLIFEQRSFRGEESDS